MRAIALSCPNCAAKLTAPPGARETTCSYCGTQSRVQARTQFFERVVPLPPPTPAQIRMPIATQRHGSGWKLAVLSSLFLTVGLGVGAVFLAQRAIRGGINAVNEIQADLDRQAWTIGNGDHLLFDVNGDGTKDLLLLMRHLFLDDDPVDWQAFDGRTGAPLWTAPSFGSYSDSVSTVAGLLAEAKLLVQSDTQGHLFGYSAVDGSLLWKAQLGEKVKELWADQEQLVVRLADKSWVAIDHKSGEVSKIDNPKDPQHLAIFLQKGGNPLIEYRASPHDRRWFQNRVEFPKPKAEGISIDDSARMANSPATIVSVGHKSPGTAVPMVAVFSAVEGNKQAELRWSAEIPANNPLSAKAGDPENYTLNEKYVVAAYAPKDRAGRVTCFSLEDGTRLWDAPLDKQTIMNVAGMSINGDLVYVSTWERLVAFRVADGSRAFDIGKPR